MCVYVCVCVERERERAIGRARDERDNCTSMPASECATWERSTRSAAAWQTRRAFTLVSLTEHLRSQHSALVTSVTGSREVQFVAEGVKLRKFSRQCSWQQRGLVRSLVDAQRIHGRVAYRASYTYVCIYVFMYVCMYEI